MKKVRPPKQLPSRGALKGITKSKKTILDYGKATPINPDTPSANILTGLRKPQRR